MAEFKKDNSAKSNIFAKDKTTLFENSKNKDELNIIIKSDVQGSSEALKTAVNKIFFIGISLYFTFVILVDFKNFCNRSDLGILNMVCGGPSSRFLPSCKNTTWSDTSYAKFMS